MSKHTPGPWVVGKWKESGGSLRTPILKQLDSDDPKSSYCVAWTVNWKNDAEDEANARLIAAAPEMRRALFEVCKMIEDVRTGKIERGVNLYLMDAQAVILETIAKAEGR